MDDVPRFKRRTARLSRQIGTNPFRRRPLVELLVPRTDTWTGGNRPVRSTRLNGSQVQVPRPKPVTGTWNDEEQTVRRFTFFFASTAMFAVTAVFVTAQ